MQQSNVLDGNEIINIKSSPKAWLVCLTASLFFFYEFVQIMMFNSINPSLMASFGITATATGQISASYFIANIVFMFPAGILLDRYSTKKIILLAMASCVLGTFFFSLTQTVFEASICRFITGIGGSFPFLCCLRLASRWFPPKKLALVSGITVTIAMLGGVAGQTPLVFLIHHFGWRNALQLDALLGIFFTILIFLQVTDYPKQCKPFVSTMIKRISIADTLKQTLLNKQNWIFGLYTCFLNLPIMILGAIWVGLYLTQVFGLSKTEASLVSSMIFFGTIVGAPLAGYISDRWGLRLKPMFLFGVISLLILLAIICYAHWTFIALIVLFFLLGLMTSSQVISYPAIAESNSHQLSGSALGFASVLIMLGPAALQPLFGYMLDLNWQHVYVHGVPHYSLHDFRLALLIIPISFILALILLFFAKETRCQHQRYIQNNKKEESA